MGAQYDIGEVARLTEWARAGIESTSAPFTELGIVFASAEHRDAAMANLGAMADQLEAARVRIEELLRSMVKLTNELPFPDEIKGWTEQRAKLVAERGTLRARVAELETEIARRDEEDADRTADAKAEER